MPLLAQNSGDATVHIVIYFTVKTEFQLGDYKVGVACVPKSKSTVHT